MTTTQTQGQAPGLAPEGGVGQGGQGTGGTRGTPGTRGGRVAGIAVRLTAGGYVLAALAYLVSRLSMPAVVPGQPGPAYLAAALAVTILVIGSLVVHELAHAVVARRHGAAVAQIAVGVFGGKRHGDYCLPGPRGQWRTAAAGPAASLVIAAVAAGGAAALAVAGLQLAALVLVYAAFVNVVLGLFSLLPGAGPDGGPIVRALSFARTGDPAWASLVAARAGQVTGAVLVAGGITALLAGYAAGLWGVLLGVLAVVGSRAQARRQAAVTALAGLRVGDVVPAGAAPVTGVQSWQTVGEFVAGHAATSAATAFPLVDFDGRPAGLLTLSQVAAAPAGRRDDLRLRDVATPLAYLVTTTGDEPLTSLLDRLAVWPRVPAAAHTMGHALVLDGDGRLAGVLTPADVARAGQIGALRRKTGMPGERAAAPRL